jgi:hypothetical protein
MAKKDELPQDLVDRLAREKNKEDRDLVAAPLRALRDKVKEDLTGGAFVGSRLNMPSNTRLGKLSAADTRLLNKTDAMKKNPYESEKESEYGFKKGGKVSSASKRADGCAVKGKTRGKIV